MNKQKGGATLWIVILIIIVAGIIFFAINQSAGTTIEQQDTLTEEQSMIEEDTMIEDSDMEEGQVAGVYTEYSEDLVASAEGDVVLFFHANWCPTCRGLDKALNEELGDIPESLTILKTDYDNETLLKQKYGINIQHTLVQVDNDGEMITKWTGGSNLDDILSKLQ